MPPAGFEPALPTSERPQTRVLDRRPLGSAMYMYPTSQIGLGEGVNYLIIGREQWLKQLAVDISVEVRVQSQVSLNGICGAKMTVGQVSCRSLRPRGLRRWSATAGLLRLRVQIPPGVWISVVSVVCFT
jgi:hypothetical protein